MVSLKAVKSAVTSVKKQQVGSKPHELFLVGGYTKPPMTARVQRTDVEVFAELNAVNGGSLFSKPFSKWEKKEREGFVRCINKCSSIRFSRTALPTTVAGFTSSPSALLSLFLRFDAWIATSTSKDCLELKKWLDPDYVIVDFSSCVTQPTPPDFATIPQHATVRFMQVAGMDGVYQVATQEDGMFVMGQFLARYPGSVASLIAVSTPLRVFHEKKQDAERE